MIEHWFATPVSCSIASEEVKNAINKEYEDKRAEIEKNLITGTWADNIASTFDAEKNLIEAFNLHELKKFILASAKELTSKPLILKVLSKTTRGLRPISLAQTHRDYPPPETKPSLLLPRTRVSTVRNTPHRPA